MCHGQFRAKQLPARISMGGADLFSEINFMALNDTVQERMSYIFIFSYFPRKNLTYGQHIGNMLDIGMGNIWGIYWETISNISAI